MTEKLEACETQPVVRKKTPLQGLSDTVYGIFENKRVRFSFIVLILVLTLLLPQMSSRYTQEVLTNAWFYIVVCLGLNIIVGFAGLLSLGYAAFFAVGAYTTGILSSHYGINFWATLPFSALAAIIAGIVIGGPTLRLRSDYLAIVTLGFGEITRLVVRNLRITGGASGLIGIERPVLFGVTLYQIQHFYYMFFVLAVLAIFVSYRLYDSRLGRAWQYIREDEDAAEAMGINVVSVRLYAFIIGSVFAAIAGSVMAAKMTAISPETFAFMQSIMILLAVVLGGMGKIPGVILGALVMVLFPELSREIGPYRMLIFGVLLLFLMIYRPQGLWPDHRT
ncbi:MAG: branched-chain amino acid ABC transporter permease [Clostridiales bacterium]|jgi:branched-chain amino acid transport system permease protein|nr:branched-chain amino acid ABC transporter permease [Clostridiales bacterium]